MCYLDRFRNSRHCYSHPTVRVITGSQQTRAASPRNHPGDPVHDEISRDNETSPTVMQSWCSETPKRLAHTAGTHCWHPRETVRLSIDASARGHTKFTPGEREHWALGCLGEKKKGHNCGPNERISRVPADHGALWRMFLARVLASVWANYRLNEALLDGGGGTMPQPFSIPTTLHFHTRWG